MAQTQYICSNCNHLGKGKIKYQGSFFIEAILWLFFIIPGLIYSAWRSNSKQYICTQCGSSPLIPTNTPKGQELYKSIQEKHPDTIAANQQEGITASKSRRKKFITYMGLAIFFIIGFTTIRNLATSQPIEGSQQVQSITLTNTPSPTTLLIDIPYQTYPTQIDNEVNTDFETKNIIIDPKYVNQTDLTALGEKLKNETKNQSHVFISIYDNTKAAQLRDKATRDELNKTDATFYDKHFVGQYTKNTATGFHQFQIYINGLSGKNQKTITY